MTGHYLNLGDTTCTLSTTLGSVKVDCDLADIAFEYPAKEVEGLGVTVTLRSGGRTAYSICLTAADAVELATTLLMYARAAEQDGDLL